MTSSTRQDGGERSVRRDLNKVPEPDARFWCAIVFACALGGVFTAFFDITLDLGLTVTTMLALTVLAAAVVLQMSASRYVPGLYWPVILLISVFAALVVDNLTDILDVSLPATGITFATLLTVTLALWHSTEGTVSIHTIGIARREAFYWLAVLFTFAFGTAASRLGAETLGVGYGATALGLALCWAIVATLSRLLGREGSVGFWAALLVARPLGGSAGALLAQPRSAGGFGWAALGVALAVLAAVGVVVASPSSAPPHRPPRRPQTAPTTCRAMRH